MNLVHSKSAICIYFDICSRLRDIYQQAACKATAALNGWHRLCDYRKWINAYWTASGQLMLVLTRIKDISRCRLYRYQTLPFTCIANIANN
eukprot:scaffold123159_cov17-Prasinocladus_malaysianus.AAC.1